MTDIKRWDPMRGSLLSRWFDEFDFPTSSSRGLKIRETKDDIIAEAVVAGVPASDIEVHIEDGVLTINAESSKESKDENEHLSSSYQYYYTAALSGGQWDKADAEIDNGIVTITIPKAEAARPRKLTVNQKKKKEK